MKGLAGAPDEGSVLLVGYHMFLGLEIISLTEQFLSAWYIAHPHLFMENVETSSSVFSMLDLV